MDVNKAKTPEDEREISLNETSLKRPLDVIDVIGGHGPWQFRQWIVFFAATVCNAMVLFSALFLPSQTFCVHENATGTQNKQSSLLEINNTALVYSESVCNSSGCSINAGETRPVLSTPGSPEVECRTSEMEIFIKCSYVLACMVSGLVVYLFSERFGHRTLALVSCLFLAASSLGSSWAGTLAVFLILRFITSLGIVSIYLISAFSLMKYVHKDFKLLYFFTGHIGWGLAHFFLSAVAWLAEDWMSFNVVLSVVCVVLTFCVWLSPENPSSFSKNCEPTRTRKALKYAAFINGYSMTDVDLLSQNYRQRQESKHDLGTLASKKTKAFCFIYSSILFLISFTTTFLYFATKWHPQWFKLNGRTMKFSFLGTIEVAATIILLFLTCLVRIKHLWACITVMSSLLLILIFSRSREGSSTSSALLFTVTVFFASAGWTLVLTKCICHKISSNIAKINLAIIAAAVFSGAMVASSVVLKADNQIWLLVLAIPHLVLSVATVFIPDYFFGTVS